MLALAFVVMALGLNIIVGFAGLLDLGYVAFFAIGAYTMGWLGSNFFSGVRRRRRAPRPRRPARERAARHPRELPARDPRRRRLHDDRRDGDRVADAAPAGRLHRVVTLAFGEIIGRIAVNGDQIRIGGLWDATAANLPLLPDLGEEATLTRGKQGITPVDKIDLPFVDPFTSLDLRAWYFVALALVLIVLFVNFRLRDSRLGRAWIALREDEVAAASMGVPIVRTKLLAYGMGAAFGGVSGAFLGSYLNTVNADQFQFSFSIFVLAMVILGGLGSIPGVVLGAVVLSFINSYLIPDVLNALPRDVGLDFDLTQLSYGIFGFLLVIMMVLRPEGLLPERRRRLEMHGIGAGATAGAGTDVEIEEERVR